MSTLPITDRWTRDVTKRLFGSPMAADVLLARWNAPDLGGFDVALASSRDEYGRAAEVFASLHFAAQAHLNSLCFRTDPEELIRRGRSQVVPDRARRPAG